MSFSNFESARGALLALFVLAIITAIFALPFQLRTNAAKGLNPKTESHERGLENYDIRTDKTAYDTIALFRSAVGKDAVAVADTRDLFVKGENELRKRVPTLKVEYNNDIRIPEIIAPDVQQGKGVFTGRSKQKHSDILLNFLSENKDLVGAGDEQISQLKVAADYTNPDGNLSYVELNQEIGGVPVFRGEIKAGFTKGGELFRVVNNFAPGLDYYSISKDFGDPYAAVSHAYRHINAASSMKRVRLNDKTSTDIKAIFGTGDFATTAEKMYFPIEPGVAVAAWRVLIWQPVNAYYVIVDAHTGTMLWRKNIGEDQTQPATYNVYANPNAMVNIADSPFPRTPGPISPDGTQGAGIARTSITRVGNEAPYTFNQLGWITDGGNETDGNNVEAGLDRDITNGVDTSNGRVTGVARTFNFPINPFNPNTNTGDSPVPAGEPTVSSNTPYCASITQPHGMVDYQRASVTQLFYIANWFHDETYMLGFTEAARNFQNTNFTGQGVGNDRVTAEGQDCSGANNANFNTPADGSRGRMQMYLFVAPTPDIDGNLDADVVIHEATHGLSNRLHGNASGLQLDLARGMGEGWSDFYAHCLLSEPSDPINAIYTIGAYDTFTAPGGNNNYYGIRRFPKAVMAFTGGPLNRPHNPLTFQDIDTTKIDLSDGAFGPRFNTTSDQVHNIGEVWSIALWEIRARMINRLGWAVGNRRVLQFVTDGMKLAPLNPTPISERDAMIAAGLASGTADDVADMWAGFALRGFGVGASIQVYGGASTGGLGTVRVTESFALPNLFQSPTLTLSDTIGNNNGIADPGETVALTIPLTNSTGIVANTTTLQIVGGNSANYGTINSGTTASQTINFTVPAGTPCGSVVTITLNVNSSLGATSFTRTISVGTPVATFVQNFDSVVAPAVPAGWAVASEGAETLPWVSNASAPDTAPNSMFAAEIDPVTPSTGGSTSLTSPAMAVTVPAAAFTFIHRYNTEPGFDGGVLDISIPSVNGGAFQDIVTAGGTFLQNGYNSILPATSTNTLGERAAWSGNSGGYVTTVVRVPAAAVGQTVQFRWRLGFDSSVTVAGGGWNVDTISFAGNYQCIVTAAGVDISGRVFARGGRGLRGAVVTLTDQNGVIRNTVTGTLGFYHFTDVAPGGTYVISIRSRRFSYSPQVVQVNDNITGLDLYPE
ncbi:MAG: M36 family metallopeptidase [Pyrinomonadaceae bacterium]